MDTDTDRRRKLDELLARSLELEAGERETFLAEACAGNSKLYEDAMALLDAADEDDAFLVEGGALHGFFGHELGSDGEVPMPARVGPFRLAREIGRGGMSIVYLAEREAGGFEQQVAIKLIRPGVDSQEVLRRFSRERSILATLTHPAIARLYDGGWTEDGRPYFTMELVDGLPIDAYCRQHELHVDSRLELFKAASDAVAHAHSRNIVHRDLKPSNILVDRDGRVRLLDFGIAKLLDPGSESTEALTLLRSAPLTPRYASPEQIRGDPVTPASDVYQLGVLLFELLTDRSPYETADEGGPSLLTEICEGTPARPSQIPVGSSASNTTTGRIRTTGDWHRFIKGDLDTIVSVAMRKEPQRRYPSAAELAEDVGRFRAGLPILARRDRLAYRVRKFVSRHRAIFGMSAIATSALVAILALHSERSAESGHPGPPVENSVAVLPFQSEGVDVAMDRGDVIAGQLIDTLAGVPELRVVAREASFAFRQKSEDARDIAMSLGVQLVVGGVVDAVDGRTTIDVRVVDGASGQALWSRRYSDRRGSVLRLQQSIGEDVVRAVTQAFGIEGSTARGASSATNDPEAFEAYLLGQQSYLQRGDGVARAIVHFRRAVELDPGFAHAWAGLASAYTSTVSWGGSPPNVDQLITDAALRAIELDPQQGSAYMALGGIYARDGDPATGAAYLYKALAVAPNDPTVLNWSAEAMVDFGLLDSALRYAQRLREVNPLSPNGSVWIGWTNLTLGNFDVAERNCARVWEWSKRVAGECCLYASLEQGAFRDSAVWLERTIPVDAVAWSQAARQFLVARQDPSSANTAHAARLIDDALKAGDIPGNTAFVYLAMIGDLDRAFGVLDDRIDRGAPVATRYWWIPSLAQFRGDPRFERVAGRVGYLAFWQEHGWPDLCRREGDNLRCD